jgi:hypothetical protein
VAILLVAPSVAVAQDLGPRGWGLRAGAASDPDQVLFGVHVDLGEIVPALRLQPSLEVGAGDDLVTLQGLVHLGGGDAFDAKVVVGWSF